MDRSDENRLIVMLGIIASVIPAYSFFNQGYLRIILGFSISSAVFGFLYILTKAVSLKSRDNKDLGPIPIPNNLSSWLYDFSIDFYGTGIMILIIMLPGYLIKRPENPMDQDLFYMLIGVILFSILVFPLVYISIKEKNKK